jgi:hypothetical protein
MLSRSRFAVQQSRQKWEKYRGEPIMTMLRSLSLFLAAAAIAGLAMLGSTKDASASGALTFFAVLNGQNECNGATPPLCHQGDLDAFGAATILLVPTPTPTVCYGIVVDNLTQNITAAHIHIGGSGTNGVVKVNLSPPAGSLGDPRGWAGCVQTTATQINQIKANPQNYYVNVHTDGASGGFTGGAIRGQLF